MSGEQTRNGIMIAKAEPFPAPVFQVELSVLPPGREQRFGARFYMYYTEPQVDMCFLYNFYLYAGYTISPSRKQGSTLHRSLSCKIRASRVSQL